MVIPAEGQKQCIVMYYPVQKIRSMINMKIAFDNATFTTLLDEKRHDCYNDRTLLFKTWISGIM